MSKQLKAGDRVSWNTEQGRTRGKVVKKLTSKTKIGSHEVKATRDDPQYLVESEKTGNRAAHKPTALRKLKS